MRIVVRAKDLLKGIAKDESGASLLEYSILIGLITAGVVGTITSVGGWVGDKWDDLKDALDITG